ncbi:DUF6483 family protein [Paenibacillus puerhi]|uniref:DUF6483 family protein n=1 Tax=Paenibacillus puerhi TaxID=2692622 RepID=UPI00135B535E|nr:DUF6483 family protein [Paenibacillus puerhi]
MYQRDYIMRLIEQMAQVIAQVINKRGQALQERLNILNQAMKRLVGLDSRLVLGLAVRDLLELISQGGRPDTGKALAISDMMMARGKLLKEEGASSAEQALEEAARWVELLLRVRASEEEETLLQEIDQRIESGLEAIGRSPISKELLELLIPYYEETGRLAKAEDALFHRLDAEEGESPESSEERLKLLEMSLERYEKWTKLDEDQLTIGGLSRAEVEQTREELAEMKKRIVNKR